ncbi:Rieske 2Fe-2S domain-containing protein [Actinoplanes sp. NPDC051851]|uniref:aromatic ring-hydroxylating dioxygenase subunit alpha n=1 Tax=Actinoplanes sp. NPDC051851 TaxID=3154753 RepID=UPI00343EFCE8
MRHDTTRANAELQAALDLAASWYVALPSGSLTRKPASLTLFGQQAVAWRGRDGRPVLMPRACPHMGASLAHGKIVDGLLECPFHGWRFDSSGACAQIPGSDHIPAAAHRQPWPVVERYGYIWAWYGSAEPIFPLPGMTAFDAGPAWYRRFRFADTVMTSVRHVLEKTYDTGHLARLSGSRAGRPRLRILTPGEFAGDHGSPIPADAWLGAEVRLPRHPGTLTALTGLTGTGAGQVTLRVDGWPAGQRVSVLADGVPQYRMLLATTPVAPGRTVQHVATAVERTGRVRTEMAQLLMSRVTAAAAARRRRPGPESAHAVGDDGVRAFQRYYQSWVDRVVDADNSPARRAEAGASGTDGRRPRGAEGSAPV